MNKMFKLFSFVYLSVSSTPIKAVDVQLIDWGTDKNSYNNREKAIAFMTLKNNGSDPIDVKTLASARVSYNVKLKIAGISTSYKEDDKLFKVSDFLKYISGDSIINPGETKVIRSIPIGVTLPPFTTADGTFTAKILIENSEIGTINGSIRVEDGFKPTLRIIK